MRGKKAKYLRRAAKKVCKDLKIPWVEYRVEKRTHLATDFKGDIIKVWSPVVHLGLCGRGFYKDFKRKYNENPVS